MTIDANVFEDAQALWDYHHLHHAIKPSNVGIGLGSLDLQVATYTAKLFHDRVFPLIVFTGATSAATRDRFPYGEAQAYQQEALKLNVPADTILLETKATNTEENIRYSQQLLQKHRISIKSLTLICRPSQERRAYATCKLIWPEPDLTCTSPPMSLSSYLAVRGPDEAISILVGDTQRIIEYPKSRQAIRQDVPDHVRHACERLIAAGFTRRLLRRRS